MMAKAELDPEYAKAAFALKKGAVSKIVESSFGYHLIQCLDRTEDRIHTRHILLRPKITAEEKSQAIMRLDSFVRQVRLDSLKFDRAAMLYCQDEDTRINGGQAVNFYRGGIGRQMDEFEPAEYEIINNLKIGEISDPYQSMDTKGRLVYKVIWLKNRTNPHVGNLKEDYNLFKLKATQIKQNDVVSPNSDGMSTTSNSVSNITFPRQNYQNNNNNYTGRGFYNQNNFRSTSPQRFTGYRGGFQNPNFRGRFNTYNNYRGFNRGSFRGYSNFDRSRNVSPNGDRKEFSYTPEFQSQRNSRPNSPESETDMEV